MTSWLARLWKRWTPKIDDLAPVAYSPLRRSVPRGRRARLGLEILEDRLVPAVQPVSGDDFASTNQSTPVVIDVLANDFDADGTLDASSLMVSSGPAHGTVTLREDVLFFDDDGSPVGNGLASALGGVVGTDCRIKLAVTGNPDFDFTGSHTEAGEYALFVRLGEIDFTNFDSGVFDFQFTGNLTPGAVNSFTIAGQTPGTSFIAWIDNTSGSGTPNTVLGVVGPPQYVYTPDPGFTRPPLVVDNPVDENDGDYSAGNLSLREAIYLANAGYADVFHYTVQDDEGLVSNEATVTVHITDSPATITFASSLTATGPTSLSISLVGDTSTDNSAFVITSPITIQGPTGANGITLAGLGSVSDLRLFLVQAGGELTLENLTLSDWATDDHGGVLHIEFGGSATLTKCTLSDSFAFGNGGAIYNFGTAMLNNSSLSRNSAASRGGAIYSVGPITLTNSTLTANEADQGGGVFNEYGTVTVIDSIFAGNTATDQGGGLFNQFGSVTLTGSSLAGNSAGSGGGFYNNGGTVTLTDCTISGNAATTGAGFYNARPPRIVPVRQIVGLVTVTDSTISGNFATQGGGFYNCGTVALSNSTIANNHADQGGGAFIASGTVTLEANCTISGNEARQGGGLLNDLGAAMLSDSTVSDNTASGTGGGIFNNGKLELSATQVMDNSAVGSGAGIFNNSTVAMSFVTLSGNSAGGKGGGLFNNFGTAALGSCVVIFNSARKGGGIFNRSGQVTLDDTAVASNAPGFKQADLAGSAHENSQSVKRIRRDGTDYLLNDAHQLLRRLPGSSWTVLAEGVVSYQVAPNGDLYLLNDHQELKRLKLGSFWTTLHIGVQSFVMDRDGTVYERDGLNRLWVYRSPKSYQVLPPLDPNAPPQICEAPPKNLFILKAARIPQNQVSGIATELVVNAIDPPRFFRKVGLAQLHHCQWKCTIYYTNLNGPQVRVIYLDTDHLHRFVAGMTTTAAAASLVLDPDRAVPAAAAASTGEPTLTDHTVQSLTSAPNGTIYKLGGGEDGYYWAGKDNHALILWRLVPGHNWKPVGRVLSYAVASDSTLYVLDADHQLRRLAPGSRRWVTLAQNVESFVLTPNGALYALDADHRLRRRLPSGGRWVTLDTGVVSLAMAPDGTVYELNDRQQLNSIRGRNGLETLAEEGVQAFFLAADGSVIFLNSAQELLQPVRELVPVLVQDPKCHCVRVRFVEVLKYTPVADGVQSFATTADGTLYVLDTADQLKRRTERGNWVVLADDVDSFVIAPNAFNNVYILTNQHELKRLEAGYYWQNLRTDVASMTIDANGTVQVRDMLDRLWLYWSEDTTPVQPPLQPGFPPPLCEDPPDEALILRLAGIPPGPDVQVLVERLVDQIDQPRSFPQVGPAQLHHCHWQCTIFYNDMNGPQEQVIFIDKDHLHVYVGQVTS